jgi:lysine/ornithine N-monooxygenase
MSEEEKAAAAAMRDEDDTLNDETFGVDFDEGKENADEKTHGIPCVSLSLTLKRAVHISPSLSLALSFTLTHTLALSVRNQQARSLTLASTRP